MEFDPASILQNMDHRQLGSVMFALQEHDPDNVTFNKD